MEIILLEDVKSLGKKDEIVKVSDGYARNFILPKKLGVEKTPKTVKELEERKALEAKRLKEILDEAKALGAKLKEQKVYVKIKGGENGKIFGSVSSKEIAVALKEQTGVEVDKKKLVVADPIKNFGVYNVPIKLHPQVTVEISVHVEAV
ncbi:MAG: 50S ribosomal protein L9 [Lachnospiraceae bacterium]|nr:50S ribosomal protein L9 [Lachnospiraceae bacterium]